MNDAPTPDNTTTTSKRRRRGSPRSIRTRDQVIEAAFDVVAATGTDGLTMQKVAERLGIGVMTVYTYVSSKDELLDELTRRVVHDVFESIPMPTDTSAWQDDIVAVFAAMRRRMSSQPSLALLLLRSGRSFAASSSDHFLIAMELIFVKMRRDGIPPAEAAMVFSAAQQYATGFSMREAERRLAPDEGDADASQWRERLDGLPVAEFPNLLESRDALLTSASDEQFQFGLRCLLAGARIEASQQPPQERPVTKR